MGDAVELAQDTHFHFFGSLVGKGHSQGLSKCKGVGNQEFNIFNGEGECFPRSSTCFVYS